MSRIKSALNTLKTYHGKIKGLGYGKLEAFKITVDMVYCRIRFHTLPDEYLMYGFMNRKDRERRYFLINYYQHGLYSRVKKRDGRYAYKGNQYDDLREFVGRDYIWVDKVGFEEYKNFVMSREKVLFKPNFGSCGRGIFTFSSSNGEAEALRIYGEIASKNYLCEDYIIQHSALQRLHPDSVNTVRVLTLNDGKEVKIIAATLRMGCEDRVCDNLSNDGIGASVDIDTGVVFTYGKDFSGNRYVCHPVTGEQIIGFKIPFWSEAKTMIKASAKIISGFAVLGWDVAFTENGPVFVEFNGSPGSRIVQIFDQKPKGREIMEYIKKHGTKKKSRRAHG